MLEFKRTKFFNTPVRLSKKQMKRPTSVLKNFYTTYNLDATRKMLEALLEVAITTDCSQFESARERSNLLFFYRNLLDLSEAAYVIIRKDLPESFRKPDDKEKPFEE